MPRSSLARSLAAGAVLVLSVAATAGAASAAPSRLSSPARPSHGQPESCTFQSIECPGSPEHPGGEDGGFGGNVTQDEVCSVVLGTKEDGTQFHYDICHTFSVDWGSGVAPEPSDWPS
jgi:hypothetical protein